MQIYYLLPKNLGGSGPGFLGYSGTLALRDPLENAPPPIAKTWQIYYVVLRT